MNIPNFKMKDLVPSQSRIVQEILIENEYYWTVHDKNVNSTWSEYL